MISKCSDNVVGTVDVCIFLIILIILVFSAAFVGGGYCLWKQVNEVKFLRRLITQDRGSAQFSVQGEMNQLSIEGSRERSSANMPDCASDLQDTGKPGSEIQTFNRSRTKLFDKIKTWWAMATEKKQIEVSGVVQPPRIRPEMFNTTETSIPMRTRNLSPMKAGGVVYESFEELYTPPRETTVSNVISPLTDSPRMDDENLLVYFSVSASDGTEDDLVRIHRQCPLRKILSSFPKRHGYRRRIVYLGLVLDLEKTAIDYGLPCGIQNLIFVELRYDQGAPDPMCDPDAVSVQNQWCPDDFLCPIVHERSHYVQYRHHCRLRNCALATDDDDRCVDEHMIFFHHTIQPGDSLSKNELNPYVSNEEAYKVLESKMAISVLDPESDSDSERKISPSKCEVSRFGKTLSQCPVNGYCRQVNNEWHWKAYLHTCALFPCPALQDPDHARCFSHTKENMLASPPPCPNESGNKLCTYIYSDPNHAREYRHVCLTTPCPQATNARHLRFFIHV